MEAYFFPSPFCHGKGPCQCIPGSHSSSCLTGAEQAREFLKELGSFNQEMLKKIITCSFLKRSDLTCAELCAAKPADFKWWVGMPKSA